MNDKLTAWLRTVVPGAWGSVVAYGVTLGAPEWVTDVMGDATHTVVVPLTIGGVYAGLRWLEPRVPAWVRVVLLGSTKTPTYTP